MELKVDAIASPVSFEEQDKYPFVHPSSTPADLIGQTKEDYCRMGEYGLQ